MKKINFAKVMGRAKLELVSQNLKVVISKTT